MCGRMSADKRALTSRHTDRTNRTTDMTGSFTIAGTLNSRYVASNYTKIWPSHFECELVEVSISTTVEDS